jgi:acyl-CoA reductase-like NAD-dependent aldehyde dehydrogenase
MSAERQLPILRRGEPYTSVELEPLCDHRTGAVLAQVSQANSGLVSRDLCHQADCWAALQAISFEDAVACCERAADIFMQDELPLGDENQGPEEFVAMQSATTAMPVAMCRRNMTKIEFMLREMKSVLRGLSTDDRLCDESFRADGGQDPAYVPRGHSLGVVLPNNSPGVHALWIPAFALRVPLYLRPGTMEPWTPYRITAALRKAGYPAAAINIYPSGHAAGNTLLAKAARGMVFGDAKTTQTWAEQGTVEIHGPGMSKVLLDVEAAGDVDRYMDVITRSIAFNGGRSCVNASSVWTPTGGRELADALARSIATTRPTSLDDPAAALCGFPNAGIAEAIHAAIESGLQVPGAEDITARYREGNRLTTVDGTTFLQPTIIWCEDSDHPLADREFLFPYASVIEAPAAAMPDRVGNTLVATAITTDPALIDRFYQSPEIVRLNVGPIPTCEIDWTQPHEGNLFHHLLQRRVFQYEAMPA